MIIWTCVLINAGMGALPFGINLWAFAGIAAAMVVALGRTRGYRLDLRDGAHIVWQVFKSVGLLTGGAILGLTFFAQVLKGMGVITMGGATAAGMALDAALAATLTYTVGYVADQYFVRNRSMSKAELRKAFVSHFKEGQREVKSHMTSKNSA